MHLELIRCLECLCRFDLVHISLHQVEEPFQATILQECDVRLLNINNLMLYFVQINIVIASIQFQDKVISRTGQHKQPVPMEQTVSEV
jgi:hypothetical protein